MMKGAWLFNEKKRKERVPKEREKQFRRDDEGETEVCQRLKYRVLEKKEKYIRFHANGDNSFSL